MSRLQHKVALVTGAASGIGAEIASRFRREGAVVFIADIDHASGVRLAASLGPDTFFLPLDVTQDECWADAMAVVHARAGRLDILVNNAGITLSGTVESL